VVDTDSVKEIEQVPLDHDRRDKTRWGRGLTGVLWFRRETAQGVVVLGVVVLLGEEEDVDELRAGTASTVAKFSGRGWPEARAISRRRSCCGDGFGLRSPC
jgi:hypothetical protein